MKKYPAIEEFYDQLMTELFKNDSSQILFIKLENYKKKSKIENGPIDYRRWTIGYDNATCLLKLA
jgi:hypothetical protein